MGLLGVLGEHSGVMRLLADASRAAVQYTYSVVAPTPASGGPSFNLFNGGRREHGRGMRPVGAALARMRALAHACDLSRAFARTCGRRSVGDGRWGRGGGGGAGAMGVYEWKGVGQTMFV